jgi:HK97 family phage portal protein
MLNNLFEKRAISFQTLWGAGEDLTDLNQSGTVINSETAFKITAIWSAVSLISDTISTLPLDAYIRRDGARGPFRPKPAWVSKPDLDQQPSAFWQSVIVSLLIDGNAFIRVFRSGGQVVNLVPLNPHKVQIRRNGIGRVMFEVQGEKTLLSSEDVIFISDLVRPGEIRGMARVEALKDNFGLSMALESYAARFFSNSATPQGIITFPGNLNSEQAENLRRGFDSAHRGLKRSHKTGVLSGGAEWKPTAVDPENSQLEISRRLSVEDVARAFNVPNHMLGVQGSTAYASVEQDSIFFVQHTLRPIVTKLEVAFSPLLSEVPGGENAFLKFNLDGLLRGDSQARATSYSIGLQAGYYTVNDIRRFEDLTPMADSVADEVRVPLANVAIEDSRIATQDKKVAMAQKLVLAGYEPKAVLAALGLPAIPHTGVPSTQLQPVAQLDPANPEGVYEVQ